LSFYPPIWSGGDLFSVISSEQFWGFMAIIFPMGLFNIIGSLQNLESAEAAGDSFKTMPSLLANGTGTVAASFFGSPFPTTIYIGHPGWKNMGARASYSAINGIVIAILCFIGGLGFLINYIPMEAVLGIILWIGIIIMAQSHSDTPSKHYLAIALGLIPCLAAWAFILIDGTAAVSGKSLMDIKDALLNRDIYLEGVIALEKGFLVTSMIYAAAAVYIIERKFNIAAGWIAAAAIMSFFGVIHAFELTEHAVNPVIGFNASPKFTLLYLMTAFILFGLHYYLKITGQLESEEKKSKKANKEIQ
jgi:AGZA family xanthine/uracil permease-like MFS transporter